MIHTGATATVSTLATVVGHPNTPTSAGNGGFSLGFPAFPSRDSINDYKTSNYINNLIIILSCVVCDVDIGLSVRSETIQEVEIITTSQDKDDPANQYNTRVARSNDQKMYLIIG